MVAINRYNINNFSNINNFTKSDAAPISKKVPVSFTEGKKNEEPKKTFTESLTNKEFLSEIEGLTEDQKGKLISEINNNKESLNKKFGEFIRGEVKFSDIVELLEEIGVKVFDEIQEFDDVNIPRNNFVYESINLITNNILSENTKLSDDLLEFLPSDLKIDKNDSKIKGISDEIDNKFNKLVAQLGKDDKANNELPGKLTDLIPELERLAKLVGVKNKNSFMQQALFRIVDKYHNKEVSTIYKKFMKATLDEAKSDCNENYAPVYFSQTIKNYYGDYTGDLHQIFKEAITTYYGNKTLAPQLLDKFNTVNNFTDEKKDSDFNKDYFDLDTQKMATDQAKLFSIKNPLNASTIEAMDIMKVRAGIYRKAFDTSSLHSAYWRVGVDGNFGFRQVPQYSTDKTAVAVKKEMVDFINKTGNKNIRYENGILTVSSNLSKNDYDKFLAKAKELQDDKFAEALTELYNKTRSEKWTVDAGAGANFQVLVGKSLSLSAHANASSDMLANPYSKQQFLNGTMFRYNLGGSLIYNNPVLGLFNVGVNLNGSVNKQTGTVTKESKQKYTIKEIVTEKQKVEKKVKKTIGINVSTGGEFSKIGDIVTNPAFTIDFTNLANDNNNDNVTAYIYLKVDNVDTEVAKIDLDTTDKTYILSSNGLEVVDKDVTLTIKLTKKIGQTEIELTNGGVLTSYEMKLIPGFEGTMFKLMNIVTNEVGYTITETEITDKNVPVEKEFEKITEKTEVYSKYTNNFDFFTSASWLKDWRLQYDWGIVNPLLSIGGEFGYGNISTKLGADFFAPIKHQPLWRLFGKTGVNIRLNNGFYFNSLLSIDKSRSGKFPLISSDSGIGYQHKDPSKFSGIDLDVHYRRNFDKKQDITAIKLGATFLDSSLSTYAAINLLNRDFNRFNMGLNYKINNNWSIWGNASVENKAKWNVGLGFGYNFGSN